MLKNEMVDLRCTGLCYATTAADLPLLRNQPSDMQRPGVLKSAGSS